MNKQQLVNQLSKLEDKLQDICADLDIIRTIHPDLDPDAKDYSSDVHQLLDAAYKSMDSAYLTFNIIIHGLHRKTWPLDNKKGENNETL